MFLKAELGEVGGKDGRTRLGTSGVSGDDLHRAVRAGIAKINVGTILNVAFTAAVRERLADPELVDPPKYLAPARDAIADTVIAITAVVSAPAGSSSPSASEPLYRTDEPSRDAGTSEPAGLRSTTDTHQRR